MTEESLFNHFMHIHLPFTMTRFQPLENILTHDVFSNGLNGWMTLMPNFTQAPDFDTRESIVVKHQWPPIMLSSATYRYPGTHGALSGTYSLKVSTRPVANRYEQMPAPGSLGHAIKRMSFHRPGVKRIQFEMWYSYTAEQDRVQSKADLGGLSENSVRAFGVCFDFQRKGRRSFAGLRYLNAVNGEPQRKWQVIKPADVSDHDWAYGTDGDWCKRGVDPLWYGRRYPDGRHDGFEYVPAGGQELCYNETDCKINWLYFRMLFDVETMQYVEFQSQDQVFSLAGMPIESLPGYARIEGLLNPLIWVENDTGRRVFLYVDSITISQD
jgi:hypothetical protein